MVLNLKWGLRNNGLEAVRGGNSGKSGRLDKAAHDGQDRMRDPGSSRRIALSPSDPPLPFYYN